MNTQGISEDRRKEIEDIETKRLSNEAYKASLRNNFHTKLVKIERDNSDFTGSAVVGKSVLNFVDGVLESITEAPKDRKPELLKKLNVSIINYRQSLFRLKEHEAGLAELENSKKYHLLAECSQAVETWKETAEFQKFEIEAAETELREIAKRKIEAAENALKDFTGNYDTRVKELSEAVKIAKEELKNLKTAEQIIAEFDAKEAATTKEQVN